MRDVDTTSLRSTFTRDGHAIVPGVLSPDACDAIAASIEAARGVARRRGGIRNLLVVDAVRAAACSSAVRRAVEAVLSPGVFAVRAILFDKTADENWSVGWHQDTAIAVAKRADVPGFGPWSVKAGVTHVRPPTAVLERMVAVRLHLDACDAATGALSVLPGSHRDGIGDERPTQRKPVVCSAARGDALLMAPLLWHASNKAAAPSRRRVIHIEYADVELPNPLAWHERVREPSPSVTGD